MKKYDRGNKKSVVDYAKKLKNKTLKEACGSDIINKNYSNKGSFGQILEEYYFEYKPNSVAEADFSEVGLELKASPLKLLSNAEYRSKERLVLNIISYLEVAKENFETSSFWKKNANLLLIFYLYEQNKDVLDYEIKLIEEWNFNLSDLEIIKKDWEIIKRKIVEGKAHELSEGDTFYLGACTKGSKGGNPRPQPNNKILAKQRAYSLKQGYVNHIIATIAHDPDVVYGKLIKTEADLTEKTIAQIVIEKFKFFYGKTTIEIENYFHLNLNRNAKSYFSDLTNRILNIEIGKQIEEFRKAEIEIKTVRLKINNLPKEDISFPTFKFVDLLEEEWDSSGLKELLEKKYLFVFYQFVERHLVLRKVKFWNMPYKDIEEVKKVWDKTRAIVKEGNIVKEVKNNIRYTNFPNKKFSKVAHVRPHAKNALDSYPLLAEDKLTKVDRYTKQSFWLNNFYIRDEIYLK